MLNVWFTSDLHLGHATAAKARGFSSIEEHDDTIIYNLVSLLNKRSKLFVLGDVAWNVKAFQRLKEVPGVKELIIGNHDKLSTREYLTVFNKVHGFRSYNEFFISHCPIHPQEIYKRRGNIHGHIHKNTATPPLPLPYFNVNIDFHNNHPVNYDVIKEAYDNALTNT